LYFVVSAAIGAEEDEIPPPENIVNFIDAGLLRIEYDHRALVYTISYTDPNLAFRIIDPAGFVGETIFSPREHLIRLHTALPIIIEHEQTASDYIYIHIHSPREVYDRIVIIDPGHGGYDQGAPSPGDIPESHMVLSISLYLYDLFAQSNSGIRAFMTRFDDDFVTLSRRSFLADGLGDLFISIHTNTYPDPSVAGTETLFNPDANPFSALFAQIVQNHLVAELNTRDRGPVARHDLYLLNTIEIPAIFAEIDFKTNPAALANLEDSQYQQRVAQALYRAIIYTFTHLGDR
jgi:N-acetylmuramoyl-L-alanine amidase